MTPVSLNPDLFSHVLDEVIGQLNLYRTKDLIDYAFRLRLVNQYANQRLERLTCRYLNIPTYDDLINIIAAGVPNYSKHEWINICGDRRYSSAIFTDGFLKFYTHSTALKRLVLDLRGLDADELDSNTRFSTCPGSVQELGILASFDQTHSRISLFMNSFLWNGNNLKLAFCGIPTYSGLVTPGGHATLALFLDETTDLYDVRLLSRFAGQFRQMCVVRLAFSDNIPSSNLHDLKRELVSILNNRLILEELLPEARCQHSLNWFADRVLNGTIWSTPGKLLTES
ncbi:hypothetical protein CALVIDRAFT_602056 [Calocera viscosa TUFC12733]|uniref:F-box domain-containing protein n=1 Tax=Calocera viscosa (strain TUFC12733) TaxID=1330018 RepID=A0A167HJF4_CALVF|nr:hypothetical protein CALVIDRAFT_602056 [Calocera viscosa TUFC12733]